MLKPIKGNPGRFLDTASGQVLNIAEYREDDKYDSVFLAGDAGGAVNVDFGAQYIFFRDIMTKQKIDTNFTQPSRLSAGEEMVIDRVGLYPRHCISSGMEVVQESELIPYGMFLQESADVVRIAENGYFRVDVNAILLIEGPAYKFPSGYGLSSFLPSTTNIGVPSTAAAAKLVKTQVLTSRHEVVGYLTFYNHDWITGEPNGPHTVSPLKLYSEPGILVTAFLHGLIKSAVNK